ncbi:MAG: hypothetical protein LC799_14710 [Actinobacteria bacterium]|nr:hypothetical protein [Actinomycetota bacterium]
MEIGHHHTKIGTRWTISPRARFELLDLLLEENHRRHAASTSECGGKLLPFLYLHQPSCSVQEIPYRRHLDVRFHLEAEVAETTVSAG